MTVAKNPDRDADIRRLIDEWSAALLAKDLDRMMSHYAPDVVFYDGIGPLQIGPDAYRKNWEGYFEWFPGPVSFETRNLKIAAGDTAAFASGLVRLAGTTADGRQDGAWMRTTLGYEKHDGKWLRTHEHWSMPMDMESGKVATDLQPE